MSENSSILLPPKEHELGGLHCDVGIGLLDIILRVLTYSNLSVPAHDK